VALSRWYARYGLVSLFLGRFIPGVRAIVAPFAGALRSPVTGTTAAILGASAIWYGIVTVVAFRAGSNWEELVRSVSRLSRTSGLVAATLVTVGIALVWWRRRRRRA
jgi:membrane protein DedA with SNARE-associated domain